MEGSKVKALTDDSLHVLIDNTGIAVNGASVKNSVADGRDLVRVLDNAVSLVLQRVHDHLDGNGMVRHRVLHHILVLVRRLMGQLGALDADPLAQAFCDHALVFHVNKLIFQGGTSAVNY